MAVLVLGKLLGSGLGRARWATNSLLLVWDLVLGLHIGSSLVLGFRLGSGLGLDFGLGAMLGMESSLYSGQDRALVNSLGSKLGFGLGSTLGESPGTGLGSVLILVNQLDS